MAGDQYLAPSQQHCRVAVILGLDMEDCRGLKSAEQHSTFNLGLHDIPIDVVAEVGVRYKHTIIGQGV